jgi:ParB family chromosome partitioning protein
MIMAPTPKRGLGRGFESLLSPDFDKISLLAASGDKIELIAIEHIEPSPFQPRRHFDETALKELAASIKQYGVVQPLVVMPAKNGKHILIAGERRWRASKLAGLKSVPAVVRSSKELEQLEVALIENVQREDLSPLDQAVSIERWHQEFNIPYDTIATRLSKAPSTVNNIVRLLQLPEPARDALAKKQISEGHARALLALKDQPNHQTHLLKSIVKDGWSVRQAERYVTGVKAGATDHKQAHERVITETPATKKLSKQIGAPVKVRRTAKGGVLEIAFTSDDELERIISHVSHS